MKIHASPNKWLQLGESLCLKMKSKDIHDLHWKYRNEYGAIYDYDGKITKKLPEFNIEYE